MNRNHLLAVLSLLAGCAPTTPRWDSQFGQSARATRAIQVANPAPGMQDTPAGMDGQAARAALLRYEQSFVTPPPPPASLQIGIGGGK
ncbi:MAG: hypothetical protein V4508_16795 [Pseudomonadota bacterium]